MALYAHSAFAGCCSQSNGLLRTSQYKCIENIMNHAKISDSSKHNHDLTYSVANQHNHTRTHSHSSVMDESYFMFMFIFIFLFLGIIVSSVFGVYFGHYYR